jgi:hypothetical protein
VSKDDNLANLLLGVQPFFEEEYTDDILGTIDSPMASATNSSRLVEELEIEGLNLVGFIESINLTFFSELRKPKLGELGSLNLNVLGDSFSY